MRSTNESSGTPRRLRLAACLLAAALTATACGARADDEAAGEPSEASVATPYGGATPEVGATPMPAGGEVPAGESGAAPPASKPAVAGTPAGGGAVVAKPGQAGGGGTPGAATGGAAEGRTQGEPTATPGTRTAAGGRAPAPAPSPGTPGPAAKTACPANPAPVIVGTVSSLSGFLGEYMSPGAKALQAWAAWVNARGGLHSCYPVKLVIGDDGTDPNRHQSLVQKLVEQDKVTAFIMQSAPFSGYAAVNYLNDKRVPVIGGEGGSPWFYESPMFFPQGIQGGEPFAESFFGATFLSGAATGKSKVAVLYCIEAPTCAPLEKAESYAKKYKVQVVYKSTASLTQPDFTAHCVRAQNAGAEVFMTVMDGNAVRRVARDCAAIGYRPLFTSGVVGIYARMSEDVNLQGHFVGGIQTPGWTNTSNPSVREMQGVLKQFGGGQQPDIGTASAWAATKLFEAAFTLALPGLTGPVTSADLLKALGEVKDNDLGGMSYPVTFRPNQPKAAQVNCFFAVTMLEGGKWAGGDKLLCAP